MKTCSRLLHGAPPLVALAALFALAAGASARQTGFDWPQLQVEGSRWPTPAAPNTPYDVLQGGYVVDAIRTDGDVVALRDGELVLLYQFVRFDAVLPIRSGVSGALVLPDSSSRKDAILVASSSGLEVFRYSDEDDGSFRITTCDVEGWNGAHTLRFDGRETVYAIDATGKKLLRSKWTGDTATALTSLPADDIILDAWPLDWNGNGTDDVLVRFDDAIEVLDASIPGEVILHVDTQSSDDRIAVSRGLNGARDLAVWYAADFVNQTFLVAGNSKGWQEPLNLAGASFDSLNSVVFDWPDALVPYGEDLFFGDSSQSKVWLLRRDQVQETFYVDPNHPFCFDLSRPGVTETLPIQSALFDLDGDGDQDALFGLSTTDIAVEAENLRIDRHGEIPLLFNGAFDTSDPAAWTWGFGISNIAPVDATHLEVEIWPEDFLGAGRPAVGLGAWSIPLDGRDGAITLNSAGLGSLSVLEVHVRAVVRDSTDAVLKKYPEAVGFWSQDLVTMETISLLPEVLPYGNFCPGCEGGDPLQGSGIILGGQGSGHVGMPPVTQ